MTVQAVFLDRDGVLNEVVIDGDGVRSPRSTNEFQLVDGVGEQRARAVREGLSRLAESSILERYV